MDVILRNRFNDVVLEELDDLDLSPFRSLAVIRLPIQWVPQVGQLRKQLFRRGSKQHLAMQLALEEHGGFMGIAVDIPQATYLPRGCVGAEVVQLSIEEDVVHVTLRGVSMLRIIDRVAMPDGHGIVRPLMQEVLEYTDFERNEGMEVGHHFTFSVLVGDVVFLMEWISARFRSNQIHSWLLDFTVIQQT